MLQQEERVVEGALYRSPCASLSSNGMVIVTPGLPGDGVIRMEEHHLFSLLAEGYGVYIIRHSGLVVNESTRQMVHNERRMQGQLVIGKENATLEDWLAEPRLAMEHFSDQPLYLVSHSFGSLAQAVSLIELTKKYSSSENPVRQLQKWISLAGVTYNIDDYKKHYASSWGRFFREVMPLYYSTGRSGDDNLRGLESAFSLLSDGLSVVPFSETSGIVSVHPKGDQYVGIDAGVNLQRQIGRVLLVHDNTAPTEVDRNLVDAHDFSHLQSAVLLDFLRLDSSECIGSKVLS